MVVCFGGCVYSDLQFFGRLWWTGRFAEWRDQRLTALAVTILFSPVSNDDPGRKSSIFVRWFLFQKVKFCNKKYWSFWDWSKWSYIPGIVITIFGVLKCQVGSLILWENHSQRVKIVCENVFQPNQTSGFGCLIFLMVFSLQPHDIVRTSPMWRVVLSSNRVYVPVFPPIDGRLEVAG